jgi:hypothetical protein
MPYIHAYIHTWYAHTCTQTWYINAYTQTHEERKTLSLHHAMAADFVHTQHTYTHMVYVHILDFIPDMVYTHIHTDT